MKQVVKYKYTCACGCVIEYYTDGGQPSEVVCYRCNKKVKQQKEVAHGTN